MFPIRQIIKVNSPLDYFSVLSTYSNQPVFETNSLKSVLQTDSTTFHHQTKYGQFYKLTRILQKLGLVLSKLKRNFFSFCPGSFSLRTQSIFAKILHWQRGKPYSPSKATSINIRVNRIKGIRIVHNRALSNSTFPILLAKNYRNLLDCFHRQVFSIKGVKT